MVRMGSSLGLRLEIFARERNGTWTHEVKLKIDNAFPLQIFTRPAMGLLMHKEHIIFEHF